MEDRAWDGFVSDRKKGIKPDLTKLDRAFEEKLNDDSTLKYSIIISAHRAAPYSATEGQHLVTEVVSPDGGWTADDPGPGVREVLGAMELAKLDLVSRGLVREPSPSRKWELAEDFEQDVLDVLAIHRPVRRGPFKRFRAWLNADEGL